MVFEGDLSTIFTETHSSLSDSELQNIRLKNMQVNESFNFVPVPGRDHLERLVEEELSQIDKLSEIELDEMVQKTLGSEISENIAKHVPVSQSMDSTCADAFSQAKASNSPEFFSHDCNASYDGSETEMEEDFEDGDPSPSEQNVAAKMNITSSHIPTDLQTQPATGAAILTPFALTIPPDVAAKMATGLYTLILEPVSSTNSSQPLSFVYKAVPTQNPTPETPAKEQNVQETPNVASDSDFEQEDVETETDTEQNRNKTPAAKATPSAGSSTSKRGLGSSHKAGNLKSYSLWMRMGITKDLRDGGMPMKAALEKWKAPRRRVMEWLKEHDAGAYAELPDYYTQEQLKVMKKLPGGGRPLKDAELEQKLINYYNELKEELYPISSELLTYECLAHNEKFLGGPESPNFYSRIADFLRNWRKRNVKRLRVPTSTGQKLPAGYTGKWEASSYYFYLETKGYDPKWVYHGDETNLPDEDVPTRVYADLGAKRVPVRTAGQEKDNKTAFLVQNSYGEKLPLYPILRGNTMANRPGFHTKKNNSTIRQRFQAKINELEQSRKRWRGLQFWVNDTSYMDEEAFLHFGRTVWKYRAGTSGEEQPPSVLLLDDLTSHKTKKVLDEFRRLYNTKIIILPGGLTPKAQIMDVTNNRPFKVSVRSKQLKLRMKKYKAAKSAQATNPLLKGPVGIPTLSREETVDIMLQAWAELSPELGAKGWLTVKLMPYELAQQVGWSPKDAFAELRHCDFPWQASSKIKPADVDAEDLGAIEWDNVSLDFYIFKKYVEVLEEFPPNVEDCTSDIDQEEAFVNEECPDMQSKLLRISRQALQLSSTPDDESEDLFVEEGIGAPEFEPRHASKQPNIEVPGSIPITDIPEVAQPLQHVPLPLPSAVFTISKPRTTTSPKSRKPAPIFTFRLPQPEPCTNPECAQDELNTVNRCNMCNTPGHASCLHDRLYCSPCYNKHMLEHKAHLAEKRKAAKLLKGAKADRETKTKKAKLSSINTPHSAVKKPKMSGGLSKSQSTKTCTQSVVRTPSMKQFTIPLAPNTSEKRSQRVESAMVRAERRQLEEAIALSQADAAPVTPLKEPSPGDYTKMVRKGSLLSPGTEQALDVEHLPSLQEHEITLLDRDEIAKLKEVKKSHFQFMMGRVNSPLVSHLLGSANLGLVDGYCLASNIRVTSINQNFRVYDLMSLLSFRPVSDAVLTCYLHWLQSTTENVYFANPSLFRYMQVFDNSAQRLLDVDDWTHYNYVCFPVNINDWHWTLAVFRVQDKATIYYMDSLNESKQQVLESIPAQLVQKLEIFGRSGCISEFNPEVEVIMVPRQKKGNNDCGMCVNEMCKTFTRDPEEFLRGEAELLFDSIIMRCTQANALLKWLYHDPCADTKMS